MGVFFFLSLPHLSDIFFFNVPYQGSFFDVRNEKFRVKFLIGSTLRLPLEYPCICFCDDGVLRGEYNKDDATWFLYVINFTIMNKLIEGRAIKSGKTGGGG